MSDLLNRHNPFTDPTTKSFAYVKATIEADYAIPTQRRRDLVSALNATSVWLGRPLDLIPAAAGFLRQAFKHVHPMRIGVDQRRLSNVRSLVKAACTAAGIPMKVVPYMAPLSDEWRRLHELVETDRYRRTALGRLFRFCSAQGIGPTELDDAVMSRFHEALEAESLTKDPRTSHQTACRTWNACSEIYGQLGWPRITLAVPRYEDRLYGLSHDDLPPKLRADLERYLAYLAGDDPFDAPPRAFRRRSIQSVSGHLRRYLAALNSQGVDLHALDGLPAAVTREMFERGMRWFWQRNGKTTSKNIGEIAWSIRCYAVRHLKADAETEAFYRNAMAKLRVAEQGLSAKNRDAMAQFDDPTHVRRLLRLPFVLMEKAEAMRGTVDTGTKRHEARLLAEAAIAVEILIFAPMRIANLVSIRLDRHVGFVDGRIRLVFERDEVKNDQRLEFLLPEQTSRRIRSFIEHWRPLFGGEANPYLFRGKRMNAKDVTAFRRQISNAVERHTGLRLTPHQFRHMAAKLLLDAKPGHYEVVRKVLGHKALTTTYAHYAGAETQAALGLYDHVILSLGRGDGRASEGGDLGVPPLAAGTRRSGPSGRGGTGGARPSASGKTATRRG